MCKVQVHLQQLGELVAKAGDGYQQHQGRLGMSRLAACVQAVHEVRGVSGQQRFHQVVLQLWEIFRHSGALLQHMSEPSKHQAHLWVEMGFKINHNHRENQNGLTLELLEKQQRGHFWEMLWSAYTRTGLN